MNYRPHMLAKVRSIALMAAHEGYPCTIRISGMVPGHRCSSFETVVGVHPERLGTGGVIGKGIATKASDAYAMAGCFHCHNLISGVDPRIGWLMEHHAIIVLQRMNSALHETLALHIEAGLILIPDGEFV